MPPSAAGEPVFTGGNKRGKGHRMVPFPPLDSPKPSFEPLSKAFAAKRGRRGLGSVRRAAFGTLLCPAVTLRELPRISVRGQTVQGGSVPLRKASLPSSVYSWSSKRPCGPLAFRRATEGSRVQRRVWGVSRGEREPLVPCPLLSPPGEPGTLRRRTAALPPAAEGGQCPRLSRAQSSPLAAYRCIGEKSTACQALIR